MEFAVHDNLTGENFIIDSIEDGYVDAISVRDGRKVAFDPSRLSDGHVRDTITAIEMED